MKRVYLYIILAVVVAGTAGYFYMSNSGSRDFRYRAEKVTRGTLVVQVRATGTINPVQTVQVGSQVSGVVSKIYVDYNSQVKKGQLVAEIDTTFLAASVKEAEANLEQNLAQKNQAERDFTRTSELFKKDLVAQADLDAAKTKYESAVAQLKQSQAALDRARVNLRYAIIRAPIDGVVISRDVDVGQTVAASLQAPKLFEIANDLKRMQVEASVDEADIGQVRSGQDVSFTVDAYPDEQFHGSVSQIRLAPITVQNVVTYTVIIDVPNPDLKLRPGMTATVSVLVDQREDVLRVPTLALRFQPPADVAENAGGGNGSLRKPGGGGNGGLAARSSNGSPADSGRRQPVDSRRDGRGGDWQRNRDARPGGGAGEARGGETSGGGGMGRSRMDQAAPSGQAGGSPASPAGATGRMRKAVRIWVLDAQQNLKPVTITTGITDNRYVEVTGGDLKEGDQVVLGMIGAEATSSGTTPQSNPFQQRMPGGGGRGRGM